MAKSCVVGSTGRLGKVVVQTLRARGDEIVPYGKQNYLIFAHRYRGKPDIAAEMFSNVLNPVDLIRTAAWDDGDCAIVMVSSLCAEVPDRSQGVGYHMSKAAINSAVRYLGASQDIRINSVSPASFTDVNSLISAREVANVIAFLCSPAASGISGQDVKVTV